MEPTNKRIAHYKNRLFPLCVTVWQREEKSSQVPYGLLNLPTVLVPTSRWKCIIYFLATAALAVQLWFYYDLLFCLPLFGDFIEYTEAWKNLNWKEKIFGSCTTKFCFILCNSSMVHHRDPFPLLGWLKGRHFHFSFLLMLFDEVTPVTGNVSLRLTEIKWNSRSVTV